MTERDIETLVKAYKDAVKRIRAELLSLDLTDMSRAVTEAALREVAGIIRELNEESAAWVAEHMPEVARQSVAETVVAAGAASTIKEAREVMTFSRMNQTLVNAVIEDTQADLLAVTQNIDRRVRSTVRKVTADSMRANMAAGINGRRTIGRDILRNMRAELGKAVETGIVDAAGRRWKPEVYVDMVVRTKTAATARDVRINEAVSRGVMYGRISTHGATDACRNYEGKIVKLTPEAPGDYLYIGDISRRELFHPMCRHQILPVRNPEQSNKEDGA